MRVFEVSALTFNFIRVRSQNNTFGCPEGEMVLFEVRLFHSVLLSSAHWRLNGMEGLSSNQCIQKAPEIPEDQQGWTGPGTPGGPGDAELRGLGAGCRCPSRRSVASTVGSTVLLVP